MKLDPNYLVQNVGEDTILVPVGEAGLRFHGVIRLNETAACLVQRLSTDASREDLIRALGERYEGTEEMFARSVDDTISALRKARAIID